MLMLTQLCFSVEFMLLNVDLKDSGVSSSFASDNHSLFVLNHFQNGVDFAVNVVKLLHLAHMQEELEILVNDAGRMSLVTALSFVFLFSLNVLANHFE
jgi:hypothetical protein